MRGAQSKAAAGEEFTSRRVYRVVFFFLTLWYCENRPISKTLRALVLLPLHDDGNQNLSIKDGVEFMMADSMAQLAFLPYLCAPFVCACMLKKTFNPLWWVAVAFLVVAWRGQLAHFKR